jgi:hypothetical protein
MKTIKHLCEQMLALAVLLLLGIGTISASASARVPDTDSGKNNPGRM